MLLETGLRPPSCGERACVTVEGALATFCLGCGAVWVEGERIGGGCGVFPRLRRRLIARHRSP
jgi:hypothetical protein